MVVAGAQRTTIFFNEKKGGPFIETDWRAGLSLAPTDATLPGTCGSKADDEAIFTGTDATTGLRKHRPKHGPEVEHTEKTPPVPQAAAIFCKVFVESSKSHVPPIMAMAPKLTVASTPVIAHCIFVIADGA